MGYANWILYSVALLVVVTFAFALPLVRSRSAIGRWPVDVPGSKSVFESIIAPSLSVLGILFVLWAVIYISGNSQILGVWPAPPWLSATGWSLSSPGFVAVLFAQYQMGTSWHLGLE